MFTGLVEKVGRVKRMDKRSRGGILSISHDPWPDPLCPGESVCVQGACLTVVAAGPDGFSCDVLEETLNRTTIGSVHPGAPVNLERALRPGDRMGGHIVTGHVDGVGSLRRIGRSGADRIIHVECAGELLPEIAPKGSVALNGISLTVVDAETSVFSVHVIPYTWSHTSLLSAGEGDAVNIETDILAKYIARRLGAPGQASGRKVTLDGLAAAGFV